MWFWSILKLHVCANSLFIFAQTSHTRSTTTYYTVPEYELLYSFLHALLQPVNIVAYSTYAWLWDYSVFVDFQTARRARARVILNQTAHKWCTLVYNVAARYELLYLFLLMLLYPVNMVAYSTYAWLWDYAVFGAFQQVRARKCSDHFSLSCTQVMYPAVPLREVAMSSCTHLYTCGDSRWTL